MGQAQVCRGESKETRHPQVATFPAFLPPSIARSHFAMAQCGFFSRLKHGTFLDKSLYCIIYYENIGFKGMLEKRNR